MLLGLVVAGVVAVGAFVLSSGGEDGDSPESSLRGFISASEDWNCDRMLGLMSGDYREDQLGSADENEALQACETAMEEAEEADGVERDLTIDELEVVEEDSETATIHLTFSRSEQESTTEIFTMVNEDGWKINSSVVEGSPEDEASSE